MKQKKHRSAFTITELITAIAVSSMLILAIGVVMVDTQRGWFDSYSKVHGGAAADAMMAKTAFDKIVRKASRSIYQLSDMDDITVYYYADWLTSTETDKYARFYRSDDDPSEMYVQHGTYESGAIKDITADVMLASNVTDLEFQPVSGGLEMKLALDDGRETTTVVSMAILHNE